MTQSVKINMAENNKDNSGQNINSDTISSNTNEPVTLKDFTENKVPSYTKLSDKYNDIKSSAATMLIVGLAGIIFMVLVIAKIIPLPLNSETSWLFNTILGGIFIIFVIAGIVSFMHAKQVKIDADEEDLLIKKILDWADKHFTSAVIDENVDLDQPEELMYFARADKIKDELMHEFESADEALVYELTEQIYQRIYESEDN